MGEQKDSRESAKTEAPRHSYEHKMCIVALPSHANGRPVASVARQMRQKLPLKKWTIQSEARTIVGEENKRER